LNSKTPILAAGGVNINAVTGILKTGISGIAVSDNITQDPSIIKSYSQILNASSTSEQRFSFK